MLTDVEVQITLVESTQFKRQSAEGTYNNPSVARPTLYPSAPTIPPNPSPPPQPAPALRDEPAASNPAWTSPLNENLIPIDPPLAQPSGPLTDPAAAQLSPYVDAALPQPPSLLYDGKTFAQWRSLWKNELKTEKRTEAIQALAAFGRAGNGKEAAEAVLDVAGEYDFMRGDSSEPIQNLKIAITQALHGNDGIPADDWIPLLLHRLEKLNSEPSAAAIQRVDDRISKLRHHELIIAAEEADNTNRGGGSGGGSF